MYLYSALGRKFDRLKINSRQDRDVLKCICLPFNADIPRDRSALTVVNGITSTSVRFKNDFYDHSKRDRSLERDKTSSSAMQTLH